MRSNRLSGEEMARERSCEEIPHIRLGASLRRRRCPAGLHDRLALDDELGGAAGDRDGEDPGLSASGVGECDLVPVGRPRRMGVGLRPQLHERMGTTPV